MQKQFTFTLGLLTILTFGCSDSGSSSKDTSTVPTDNPDSGSTIPTGNQEEGNWIYSVSEIGEATLLWSNGAEKSRSVVMIPAKLGGFPVATFGDGTQNVLSNNKVEDNFVLFPTSITTISAGAVYDYNDTAGWVLPSSITSIADTALVSCQGGTFHLEAGSAAESYAKVAGKTMAYLNEGNYVSFTVSAGDEGYVQPNGTYFLPEAMLGGSYADEISIVADIGYKIASVSFDGQAYDFLAGAEKQNEITATYKFTTQSSGIVVTFEEDPDDTRATDSDQSDYVSPEVLSDAVTDGTDLPDDVEDYAQVNTGSTSKYENSMGISTGIYYAANGKLYRMVHSSQKTDEPEYYSKAEVINGVFNDLGLVYGDDYDLIRLYNYSEEVTSGPAQGVVTLYATYLYEEVPEGSMDLNNFGVVEVDENHVNTAALFAQAGANLHVTGLVADVHTGSKGPSEAGNFYGLGSAIHVDGGDVASPATNVMNQGTAYLKLSNPQILGPVNSIYSLASGVLEIAGGNVFSCSSGGHGPYVSTGGQIFINTDGSGIVGDDGAIVSGLANLTPSTRPADDLGSMARDGDGDMAGVYGSHGDDVTVIVTGDEAGTTLATDTGGGVIVANQVVAKAYGLRSGGVYSIGFDESWVYAFNSIIVSSLDAGLVSASGGYAYAYNSDITGVMGIKTRAGGNVDSSNTGVTIENSRVAAYYDTEEMQSVYDVAIPEDWDDSMADQGTGSNQLNIFLDKANDPNFYEESLDWWFKDKSSTPGYSGGNKFAVIYIENSPTPIYVIRSQLINRNYAEYGVLSEAALAAGQTPADNLLVSVEGGGNGNLYFTDENSETLWDLTGVSDATCELLGDFYLGAAATASDDPNLGTGSNSLSATFSNSEWVGTVLRGDDSGIINLTFDESSTWQVTGDAIVSDLSLPSTSCIAAEEPVTITVAGSLTIAGEAVTTSTPLGNVTFVLDPSAITIVESSGTGGDGTPPDIDDGTPPEPPSN